MIPNSKFKGGFEHSKTLKHSEPQWERLGPKWT